ncbi:unnamed protein product [Vitrella brassicaformis CCMP3155]|uniref:Uncharacterized protein n=1 Tax=Vitrella brassicaformis (strain CCMP3155) TaxID=1169540 RepID=A0A0G4GNS1_VITBC|nr:unnamed protein product [Vitrella brassicaformis CCMP3155]|eukprot:CEM31804.1 unnamed protein product [Vitrella brassicaformis CCMP3155]
MTRRWLFVVIVGLVAAAGQEPVKKKPVAPKLAVDPEGLVGTWYLMYTSLTEVALGRPTECVVTEVTKRPGAKVALDISSTGSRDGKYQTDKGVFISTDPKDTSKWKLQYDLATKSPALDMEMLYLGKKDKKGAYDSIVIADPSRAQFHIAARDWKKFADASYEDVLKEAKKYGIGGTLNALVSVTQGGPCKTTRSLLSGVEEPTIYT